MEKINLEDFCSRYGMIDGYTIHSNLTLGKVWFNRMMIDYTKKVLELAAKNAKLQFTTSSILGPPDILSKPTVDKQSILNTINQIE